MYTPHLIPIPTILANWPLRMPINIQLALPNYVTANAEEHIFNVPAAINDLMGSSGWRAATGVMRPRVWARGWNDEQLRDFVTKPFGSKERRFPTKAVRMLRARDFPGLRSLAKRDRWGRYPKYEIIHFVGSAAGRNNLSLRVSSDHRLTFGALRDALFNAETRLFILQLQAEQKYGLHDNRYYLEQAVQWATYLVGSGGPTVLVVSGNQADVLDNYFLNLYAGIVHNQSLSQAAQPTSDALTVELFFGEGGDEILRFDRFRDELYSEIAWMREMKEPLPFSAVGHEYSAPHARIWEHLFIHARQGGNIQVGDDILATLRPFLHQAHFEELETEAAKLKLSFEHNSNRATEGIAELKDELDWSHETGGALPLSQTARTLPKFRSRLDNVSRRFYRRLIEKAAEHIERGPRVLNANFGDPRITGGLLQSAIPSDRGLVAGDEYDLWVDVGPRWSVVPSIVEGSDVFPEWALPLTEEDGWVVQVVLVSEDFSPRMTSAQMWVPSKTGRSFPINQGDRAPETGPVALHVRAPLFPEGDNRQVFEARGRLCLYFGNNLLQSALVKAAIVRSAEVVLKEATSQIEVDFNMVGSFQEVERFATRGLVLDEQGESDWLLDKRAEKSEPRKAVAEGRALPVALNLTLNDDGSGKHRILVKNDPALQPVWKPYNLLGNTKLLGRARAELTNCFRYRNTQDCSVSLNPMDPTIGLNNDNGKNYQQFACDLRVLAIFGERLFNIVYEEVDLAGTGMSRSNWEARLRTALATRAVIQVARTGEAEYTFPWAMVYEYPLPDKDSLHYCRVIQEWNAAGVRKLEVQKACPAASDADHDKNVLCPYGFWGLKHHIEQPIPPLVKNVLNPASAPQTISIGKTPRVSVGVTRDPELSLKTIDEHLKQLAKISTLTPPDGADEWSKVQTMLKSAEQSPDIVYFLCHGAYDDQVDQPFLGIGMPDGQFRYRVYPNELIAWSRGMSAPLWQSPQPLVFINGCHTFALLPDQILNFVSTFAGFGASGVIGTEVSILLPLATEIAELLFDAFVNVGMTLGEAMHQIRWKLANKGNLLGLAYTPYGQSDLKISQS